MSSKLNSSAMVVGHDHVAIVHDKGTDIVAITDGKTTYHRDGAAGVDVAWKDGTFVAVDAAGGIEAIDEAGIKPRWTAKLSNPSSAPGCCDRERSRVCVRNRGRSPGQRGAPRSCRAGLSRSILQPAERCPRARLKSTSQERLPQVQNKRSSPRMTAVSSRPNQKKHRSKCFGSIPSDAFNGSRQRGHLTTSTSVDRRC